MKVNLVRFKKNGEQKIFPLPKSTTTIGRQHDCDLRIPLMSVSKKHCQLNCDGEVVRILDLDSHNGTYLNGKRINEETTVQAGNYIKVGPLTFVLQVDGEPKDIPYPDVTVEKPSQEDKTVEKEAQAQESSDEQFMSFMELEGGGSAEEGKGSADEQFSELTGLEEDDSSEKGVDATDVQSSDLSDLEGTDDLLEQVEEMTEEKPSSFGALEDSGSSGKAEEAADKQFSDLTDLEETDLLEDIDEDEQGAGFAGLEELDSLEDSDLT